VLHRSIVAWIVGVCSVLRRSQAKALAEIAWGAMRCRRASQADIGRAMETGTVTKHNIKRTSRFVSNNRVDIAEGCRGLVGLAAKAGRGNLVIAVDWVDVRQYKVLRAAVPLRGRSVPILFATYEKWKIRRSQNSFEEDFFRLLATLLPAGTSAIIIADRGFARAELVGVLAELGLSHVIRVETDVCFRSGGFDGKLSEIGLTFGKRMDLGFGRYTKRHPVKRRVVACWQRGYKEPWIIGTDLDWPMRTVFDVFSQRMMIEELFRDEKNIRYGWGLRQISLSSGERLERMLLVLAFAYLLLLLIGLVCRDTMSEAHWASATSKSQKQASAFFVGRHMQTRVKLPLRTLLKALSETLAEISEGNWG